MKIVLIRHGETLSNRRRCFLGVTDEPLTEEGKEVIRSGVYPEADLLFCSPMLRCRQTASLIYPDMAQEIVPGLREMDFGIFEGKSHDELSGDPMYEEWLQSGGGFTLHGAESMAAFQGRCVDAFLQVAKKLPEEKTTAFVIHGGVIMAILSGLVRDAEPFYHYMVQNGGGYVCCWNGKNLNIEETL